MLDTPIAFSGNTLLAKMTKSDIELLRPSFESIDLKIGEELYETDRPIEYVYFLLSGICSIIAENDEGTRIETGLIGREGFIGIPVIHYAGKAPSTALLQAEGRALRLKARQLGKAFRTSPTLHKVLLQFAHVFSVQVAQTAISNGHNTINERLARWLLMCQDRADSIEFPMTHQFLSHMLAVRRAGITDALNDLEGRNAIKALRGRVVITTRSILEKIAGGAYGVPEKEYERLIGS
jgi:CRP-like cAMP-binding protein